MRVHEKGLSEAPKVQYLDFHLEQRTKNPKKRYLTSFHIYVRLPARYRCTVHSGHILLGLSKRVRKLTFKIVCSETFFWNKKCSLTPSIRGFNLELSGLS